MLQQTAPQVAQSEYRRSTLEEAKTDGGYRKKPPFHRTGHTL